MQSQMPFLVGHRRGRSFIARKRPILAQNRRPCATDDAVHGTDSKQ